MYQCRRRSTSVINTADVVIVQSAKVLKRDVGSWALRQCDMVGLPWLPDDRGEGRQFRDGVDEKQRVVAPDRSSIHRFHRVSLPRARTPGVSAEKRGQLPALFLR